MSRSQGYVDGTAAKFHTLMGVAVDGYGQIFVSEFAYHSIRKIVIV